MPPASVRVPGALQNHPKVRQLSSFVDIIGKSGLLALGPITLAVPKLGAKERPMSKWECPCGYVYDPEEGDTEHGVQPGTRFEDIPADWVCPWCEAEKEYFEEVE